MFNGWMESGTPSVLIGLSYCIHVILWLMLELNSSVAVFQLVFIKLTVYFSLNDIIVPSRAYTYEMSHNNPFNPLSGINLIERPK